MKRVIAIALMAIFSTAMFAQTKTETKPTTQTSNTTQTTHKKKSHTTEAKAPAKETKPAAQSGAAQPTVKKTETATPAKK
jgi:hypothetical protein